MKMHLMKKFQSSPSTPAGAAGDLRRVSSLREPKPITLRRDQEGQFAYREDAEVRCGSTVSASAIAGAARKVPALFAFRRV